MKRSEPSNLFLVMALASVVRIPGMSQMLWYDEAYTANLARKSIPDMIAATLTDVHPPTWYFVESAFVRMFGNTEWALRAPSLLLGVLSVYLTYRLARHFTGHRPALVAAGLLAVNPFAVYYSNEARMYALLLASFLVACIGAVENRRWLLGIGTGVMLLSHNTAIIYLPALALLVMLKSRSLVKSALSHARLDAVSSMALGAVPWLAWIPSMVRQATTGQFSGSYWVSYFTGSTAARLLADWCSLWTDGYVPWLNRIGALVVFSLIVFPVITAIRRKSVDALILSALAFSPGLTALVISEVWQPIEIARILIGSLPGWCALVGWWITLKRKWDAPRVALIGLAGAVIVANLIGYYFTDRDAHTHQMLDWLTANAAPDDVVCHTSESVKVYFDFYYNGKSMAQDGASHCDWLVYERYITSDSDIIAKVDQLVAERGTLIMNTFRTPVLRADLYKLQWDTY